MKDSCAPFAAKKITLLGLGLLGRGVGDAEFLAKCGARVVVTDTKNEAQLAESVERLKKYPHIEFHLGGHRREDFTDTDLVIKAAGVPLDSPEVAAAREAGVEVAMSTALFAKYASEAGAKIVGVTGTRGKSTVSHMIFHVLAQSGRRAHLGGNVRGISTLAILPDVGAGDIVVLELDSWQLQGFGDLHISPHTAVFTNLMPDHQNYYSDPSSSDPVRAGMEAYFNDKANIFRYQNAEDALFVGKGIIEKVSAARPEVAPRIPDPIPETWTLKIPGAHNRENAAFAGAVLETLGVSREEIKHGIESFEAVEGRLQFVREIHPLGTLGGGGIKIYNDNNATTPEATIAALKALGPGIALIAGGSDKGLALDELVAEIQKMATKVVLLTHEHYSGTAKLAEKLKTAGVAFEEAASLTDAIARAMKNKKDGCILFSPAFASFGMFKNEYDRNDQWTQIVENWR